ncbi:MAG: TssN family type VI secretion system protein [Chitinophagaceae bacterium]
MQTTTKIFTIIMASGLVAGIGLITMAQSFSESFKSFGKKPIVIGIVTALLCAGSIYLAVSLLEELFLLFWVMSFIFLLFGGIHQAYAHKKFIYEVDEEKNKVVMAEWLFVFAMGLIAVVAFAALQFFVIDKTFLFYPLLFAGLFFMLPVLMNYSFEAAYKIPYPMYKSWEYPVNNPIDPPEDNPNEKLLVIGFEIPKKMTDAKRTYFRAKTPESITLGDLFYHFINDYNELQSETPIQIAGEHKLPLIWYFRLKPRWYQRSKVLDPQITIRENKVRENSVIICEHFNNQPNQETNEG